MASIRIARVLATVAAAPLLLGAVSGVAHAADDTAVAGSLGGGVLGNTGNIASNQQAAAGRGASNESNTANVNESAFVFVDQSDNTYYTLIFDVL
ncbi:hypothetical protein [Streptomyces sp. NBRC 109706]|uniref:hypothetical protein n=1 Tax=Streptomyces sp. NBRC 109706 TaxID=1550035 RepID=UPI0007822FF0|nr:hypothetical protein [Streptomyces sp. NBRC 109706]